MAGSKDNPSGGHGIGSGLRGGKAKQASHVGSGLRGGKTKKMGHAAAGSGLGRGSSVSKSHGVGNGPSVGVGVGSGRGIDPKDASGNTTTNETTVWRHGSYVKIRPPKGKGRVVTLCTRGGAGSYKLLDSSNSMADLDGLLHTTTSLHDTPKDIPNDDDDDLDGDFDDMGDSDEDDFGRDGDDGGSGGEGGADDGDGSGGDGGDVGDADGRELIIRQGKAFGTRINRSVKGILDQCLDGDWITFKKVPVVKQKSMFKRFKTKYRWDPRTEQNIYDGFINVLKRRFRDNMKILRKKSRKNAMDDGHEFPDDKDNFDIMCKYSPDDSMPLGKWQRMCNQWNTEKWKKKGKKGDKVRFRSLFIATHATKECKKRLRDGEITEKDLDKLEFVTPRAKRSYVSYMQQLQKLYGNMDCDDLDVWESLHPECQGRPLFGVGSADPLFVVTGTPSSTTCGSYGDAQQSQELQKVQAKLDNVLESRKAMEALLEQHEHEREEERAEREREREKERVERELEREKEHAEREEWQKRMEEMFKKLTDK